MGLAVDGVVAVVVDAFIHGPPALGRRGLKDGSFLSSSGVNGVEVSPEVLPPRRRGPFGLEHRR